MPKVLGSDSARPLMPVECASGAPAAFLRDCSALRSQQGRMAAIARPTGWAPRPEVLPRPLSGARCCPSHERGTPKQRINARRYGAALPRRRAVAAAAAPLDQAQGPTPASAAPAAVVSQSTTLPSSASSLAENVEVDVTGTAHHLGAPSSAVGCRHHLCSCTAQPAT